MKIKVLHQDKARYEFIRSAVADKHKTADISGSAVGVEHLSSFINGTPPDVLIIDQATPTCLAAVESLSLRSPGIETLLISGDSTVDFLMHAMRAGVREVIPQGGSPEALQAALARCLHKRAKQIVLPADEGQVFAFVSCKGGSGATFLAANFAYAAASEFGKRVALIDLNLQFGDAAIFVSESRPPSHLAELAQQIHRLDASLLGASMLEAAPNLFVLAAPDDPAHAGDVKREHVAAIVRLAKAHYDFVVLDVSRSLDGVSLQALDLADTIFPVLQLTLPFVRDGKRLLSIFRSLDYPRSKVQLVVNRYEKGGEFSLQDLEQALEAKVAHVVPNSYVAAAASVNLGIPILKGNRANPISQQLLEMARCFVHQESPVANGGWLSRIFSRPAAH
ncbi:MAG: AAA family ATPase [Bacteroidota bacterium]